jgi:hypothetical protein
VLASFPLPQAWHLCLCSVSAPVLATTITGHRAPTTVPGICASALSLLQCLPPPLPVTEFLLPPLFLALCFSSVLEMSSTESISVSSTLCARWTHKHRVGAPSPPYCSCPAMVELACATILVGIGHHHFNECAVESAVVPSS